MYKTNVIGTSLVLMIAALAGSSASASSAKIEAERKGKDSPVSPYLRMLLHPELAWKPRKSKGSPEKLPKMSDDDLDLPPEDNRIRAELKTMLATYAPRVWLHHDEAYPPMDPLEFIEKSSLHIRGPSGRDKVLVPMGHIQAETLAQIGGADPHARPYQTGSMLNGAGYFLRYEDSKHGARKLATFLATSKDAPMFWRMGQGAFAQLLMREGADASKKRIVIEYWYHTPYNLATRIGIGNHQGDWEGVSMLIELEAKNGVLSHRLLASFFAEHEGGTWKCASEVSRSAEDARIEAFSAKGTHATYPSPGRHRNAILTDETERGTRWDSWQNLKPLALEPYYGFSGAWGEPHFFSFMTGPLVPGPGYKPLPRESTEKEALRTLATLIARCGA